MTISVLVYGTLKRGQWNHDRFCRHALDIRPATTVGRLYDLPAGRVVPRFAVASLRDEPPARLPFASQAVIPALAIPEEAILAHGTGDPLADAETQVRITARDLVMPEATDGWDTVHGELITFADPIRDLPPLDRLEGFRPAGHGLYRRALVAVRANTGVEAAWVYHMARPHQGRRLSGGFWPDGHLMVLR